MLELFQAMRDRARASLAFLEKRGTINGLLLLRFANPLLARNATTGRFRVDSGEGKKEKTRNTTQGKKRRSVPLVIQHVGRRDATESALHSAEDAVWNRARYYCIHASSKREGWSVKSEFDNSHASRITVSAIVRSVLFLDQKVRNLDILVEIHFARIAV